MTRLDAMRLLLARPSETPDDEKVGHVVTYDDKQINAVLTVCTSCGRSVYMTDHSQTVCVKCRRAA